MAEIELSTLCERCPDRRIPSLARMKREIEAWVVDRNQRQTEINWHEKTTEPVALDGFAALRAVWTRHSNS